MVGVPDPEMATGMSVLVYITQLIVVNEKMLLVTVSHSFQASTCQ